MATVVPLATLKLAPFSAGRDCASYVNSTSRISSADGSASSSLDTGTTP